MLTYGGVFVSVEANESEGIRSENAAATAAASCGLNRIRTVIRSGESDAETRRGSDLLHAHKTNTCIPHKTRPARLPLPVGLWIMDPSPILETLRESH